MKPNNSNYINTWQFKYQFFLAILAVLTFFTKLDSFLEKIGIAPPPLFFIAAFTAASIPLFFSVFTRWEYFPPSIIIWSIIYYTISSLSILAFQTSPSISDALEKRVLYIFFLLLMTLFFSKYEIIQLWARKIILVVGFINIGLFIYEFYNPGGLGVQDAVGRSAGFYGDPNDGGAALILSMIFGVELLNPKWRFTFILLTGLGVFLTFSRGAMLILFISIVIFLALKIIPKKQLLISILATAVILQLFAAQAALFGNVYSLLSDNDSASRILSADNSPTSLAQDGRVALAEEALNKFARSPFIGNGIESSRSDTEKADSANLDSFTGGAQRQKPHNTYLMLLVEHGFLGFFIYPLLILGAMWNAQGKAKKMGIVFAIFFLIRGTFSHTMLEDRFFLISIALMACISRQSQLEQNLEQSIN
jgi:O-antigen ligase